jgi:D-alanyl-D-alanine carboxypeptidase
MDAAVKDGVPGVTATARDTDGTWSATACVGDVRTRTPRGTADHYRVGSITKTFVSTVLLQPEAERRLSLDDKVEKWLPGVVRGHGHDGRRITVRRLLNHASGIFNYTADEDFARTYFLKDGFSNTATTRRRPSSSWRSRFLGHRAQHRPAGSSAPVRAT